MSPNVFSRNAVAALAVAVLAAFLLGGGVFAQPHEAGPTLSHQHGTTPDSWEGSREAKAYSEFNHRLAGVFVLLIGMSEARTALAAGLFGWLRFLLPAAMLGAGTFLLVWSDHDAWPIGSQTFIQTFISGDLETVQHKLYSLLLLGVGSVETLKRAGRLDRAIWGVPLPAVAILGGTLLFLHSHGTHPSASTIAMHHAVMGTTAIVAGLCKVTAEKTTPEGRSPWGLAWAALVLLVGVELFLYTE
jgi:putative copper resistance protein D